MLEPDNGPDFATFNRVNDDKTPIANRQLFYAVDSILSALILIKSMALCCSLLDRIKLQWVIRYVHPLISARVRFILLISVCKYLTSSLICCISACRL